MKSGIAQIKAWRHFDVLLVFASMIAPVVLATMTFGRFVVLPASLKVEGAIADVPGLDRATLLRVNVSNGGDRPLVPHFFVIWSGIPSNVFVPWSYGPNASAVPGKSYRVFVIEAPDPERAIPNGSIFYVRLYDESTQEYAFSQAERLILP